MTVDIARVGRFQSILDRKKKLVLSPLDHPPPILQNNHSEKCTNHKHIAGQIATTEHIHGTSTEIKKQNIPSHQKASLVPLPVIAPI